MKKGSEIKVEKQENANGRKITDWKQSECQGNASKKSESMHNVAAILVKTPNWIKFW